MNAMQDEKQVYVICERWKFDSIKWKKTEKQDYWWKRAWRNCTKESDPGQAEANLEKVDVMQKDYRDKL